MALPTHTSRHPVETMRVKTWFNAVALRSGKTAYGLELEFSAPQSVQRFPEGTVQRPGLWDKYARGEVTPGRDRLTLHDHKPNIVDTVEARYRGTACWLRHPLWVGLMPPWRAIKPTDPLAHLNGWMRRLPAPVTALLFAPPPPEGESLFDRRPVDSQCLDHLSDLATVDAAAALLLLLKEAILRQDSESYRNILDELHHYDSWFAHWPETAPIHEELLSYIDRTYGRQQLPDPVVGWRQLHRDWLLIKPNWWSAGDRPSAARDGSDRDD